ncbi:MAG: GntR family transcriptional regulator [Defluviitaleaceae bacterium]|nr:GntR family transcriptional regulator [Defluviitaleaceae bacterium]
MKGDFDNNSPIYRQIIDQILLSIAKGELPSGGKVAPVRELAAAYRVNPNTMQKSLAKLEEMGYLYSERTSGRYVTKQQDLIERLQASLPAQITEKYVAEMLECGMALEDIPSYVKQFVKEAGENG